jgi:hypothetical protein
VRLGRLDTGIACLNPAQYVDICPRLSVLCRAVYVQTLGWTDRSCALGVLSHIETDNFRSNSELEQGTIFNP